MKRNIAPVALGMLGVLCVVPRAAADVYYPDNTTVNDAVSGSAIVGYDNAADLSDNENPTSPTVNFVAGSSISSHLYVYNNSTVTYGGGEIGQLIETFNNSSFTMTAGTVDYDVDVEDNSLFNMQGGTINYGLEADNTGTANISGGSISSAFSTGSGDLNITGGTLGGDVHSQGSTTTISGGTFAGTNGVNFFDDNTGAFSFFGRGLSYVDDGPGTDTLIGASGEDYTLSGTLEDGNSINGDVIFVASSSAMFSLNNVPEPSASLVLAAGFLGLCVVRPHGWRPHPLPSGGR